jgi:hypothetical protein
MYKSRRSSVGLIACISLCLLVLATLVACGSGSTPGGGNPTPAISSLNPASVGAGSAGFTLTVTYRLRLILGSRMERQRTNDDLWVEHAATGSDQCLGYSNRRFGHDNRQQSFPRRWNLSRRNTHHQLECGTHDYLAQSKHSAGWRATDDFNSQRNGLRFRFSGAVERYRAPHHICLEQRSSGSTVR